MNPHDVTRAFERDLCEYTGAPYAVAVNSCTMALLLSCAWVRRELAPITPILEIPKRTYVGVPMAISLAGCGVRFRDEEWHGQYALRDVTTDPGVTHVAEIWDAARRFRKGMYQETLRGTRYGSIFQCVSFHTSKICGHTQGGAILHGDARADAWLRRARFDGRTEGVPPTEDVFDMIGWHCYMSPDVAAALRWKLSVLPRHNEDLPNSDYSDLSIAPVFQ